MKTIKYTTKRKAIYNTRFFKPLVASTLALSLSAFANANCVADEKGNPIFCYGSDSAGSSNFTPDNALSWSGENILSPFLGGNAYLETLKIAWSKEANDNIQGSVNTANRIYTINVGANHNYFLLGYPQTTTSNKGIKLGENGNGMLALELATGKTFELDLSKVAQDTTAFEGNISVIDGTFQGDFGGNFKGNVTLSGTNATFDFSKANSQQEMKTSTVIFNANGSNTKNQLVIKNAILSGQIRLNGTETENTIDVSQGSTQNLEIKTLQDNGGIFNFRGHFNGNIGGDLHSANEGTQATHKSLVVRFSEDSKMTGNILSLSKTYDDIKMYFDVQLRVVEFGSPDFPKDMVSKEVSVNAADNIVLEGDIVSAHALVNTFSKQHKENYGLHAIFHKGSMKGNVVVEHPDSLYDVGYVNAVFLQDGAKLEGNISNAGGFGSTHKAEADIVFKGNLGNLKSESIKSNVVKGWQTSGFNNIYFEHEANIEAKNIISIGGKNIISIQQNLANSKAGTATTVIIGNLSAQNNGNAGGANYIGKNLLSLRDNTYTLATAIDNLNFAEDTNAFSGKLQIKNGVLADKGGVNNIIFKATNAQDAAIISAQDFNTQEAITALGNAIEGHANLYLDLSDSSVTFGNASAMIQGASYQTDGVLKTLLSNAVIAGDIDTLKGGNINLKIKGGTADATQTNQSGIKLGLVGNLKNTSGNLNFILEDSIWLPSEIQENNSAVLMKNPLTGKLVNNDGTTNLVLRETGTNALKENETSIFNINTGGESITNIVVQGGVNVGANINYGGYNQANGDYLIDGKWNESWISKDLNKINLIFAHHNDAAGDSFAKDATDIATNNAKVLGKTYQDGIKLVLQDKLITTLDQKQVSFLNTYKQYFIKNDNDPILKIKNDRTIESNSFKDVIVVDGLAIGNVVALKRSEANKDKTASFDVTLNENSVFFGGFDFKNLGADIANTSITLTMKEKTKFFINSSVNLQNLNIQAKEFKAEETLLNTFAQSNVVIDLGSYGNDNNNIPTRSAFNLLGIGDAAKSKAGDVKATEGLEGSNALFRVYANIGADQNSAILGIDAANNGMGKYGYVYSDRIVVDSVKTTGDNPFTEYVQVLYDAGTNTKNIAYVKDKGTETAGNIAVFTVKNDASGKALINLVDAKILQGFDVIKTNFDNTKTDRFGKVDSNSSNNAYTTYFIDSVETKGISLANQQAAATSLSSNYELYLANMNSLNKRMGELRNNANAQGVWARVFNGMQTSKFSLETTSIYTTFQAGYDYAFGMEGANNYLGFAVAYNNSLSESKSMFDLDGKFKGLKDSTSNGVEFAVYNAYVQDGASSDNKFKNGLFTDTILKFSYINNKININNQSETYSVDNFAITLSQEVGYRFLLGNAKEWFIDPQAELTLGFLDQSNLKQKLGTAFLDGTQGAILTLRGRVGSNFGYKFDKFTENKGFKSQVYLGTYFVGDYISGGDITLVSDLGSTTALAPLNSTGRFTMNLGTNFTIKDHHRIYFDFERSFGGKITTIYQVNLGYRYSFGENKKYMPMTTTFTSEVKKDNKKK